MKKIRSVIGQCRVSYIEVGVVIIFYIISLKIAMKLSNILHKLIWFEIQRVLKHKQTRKRIN